MDPELNRYILLNESEGLIPGYPQSSLDILGKRNIAAVSGKIHKKLRGSLLSLIGSPKLREQLLSKADRDMRIFLQNWDGKTVDIQQKAYDVSSGLFKQIFLIAQLICKFCLFVLDGIHYAFEAYYGKRSRFNM